MTEKIEERSDYQAQATLGIQESENSATSILSGGEYAQVKVDMGNGKPETRDRYTGFVTTSADGFSQKIMIDINPQTHKIISILAITTYGQGRQKIEPYSVGRIGSPLGFQYARIDHDHFAGLPTDILVAYTPQKAV